jgi:hypothetical protein
LCGCDQWFDPAHPLARYCEVECRGLAKAWREWKARQRYRESEKGRIARQQQSARRRERLVARQPDPASEAADAVRVGHRDHVDVDLVSCDRPGCYETFAVTRRSPMQRFCSCSCRLALRRVLLRERRWRCRLRNGSRTSKRAPPRA